MAMMWTYMLANIIVDVLVMYECITGISAALLGLTVLSWGNSVGDAFASVAISKNGFGEMAITGCVAGPVFNLLLGLGLTTLRCNMMLADGIKYKADDPKVKLTLFTLGAMFSVIAALFWLALTNRWKLARWHGHVLVTIYVAIVAVTIYQSFTL
jgi:solute carrier family 24 (sodium/potassium/calcium exchanger), member 6